MKYLILLLLIGCAPNVHALQEHVSQTLRTSNGCEVHIADSLDVANVMSQVEAARPMPGVAYYVFHYPVVLPSPQVNPFDGKIITAATSYTDLPTRTIYLSSRDGLVEDQAYEQLNLLCGCEHGRPAN